MHVISDFQVEDKAELYEKLDAAVTAVSPNVPFGLIHKDDQAHRN